MWKSNVYPLQGEKIRYSEFKEECNRMKSLIISLSRIELNIVAYLLFFLILCL